MTPSGHYTITHPEDQRADGGGGGGGRERGDGIAMDP